MGSIEESSEDENLALANNAETDIAAQFMEITGCNRNLTESILLQHNQDLEAALQYFYGPSEDAPRSSNIEQEPVLTAEDLKGLEVSLISWNVDGLDDANRTTRFNACLQILKRVNPDFIFLQEVVQEIGCQCLSKMESDYKIYFSDMNAQYFTALMVNKQLDVKNHQVIHYENSGMGRTLQILEGRLGPLKVFLLNTHLESMGEFSAKRREQFRLCMNKIQEIISTNPGCLVYFGGDLNIRDKEIQDEISCIPDGVADAWQAAGSSFQHRYTFDMTQNDNKSLGRAKCRFDRIFFYGPLGISNFELEGKQRIRTSLCFPSDHFAVSCTFKA